MTDSLKEINGCLVEKKGNDLEERNGDAWETIDQSARNLSSHYVAGEAMFDSFLYEFAGRRACHFNSIQQHGTCVLVEKESTIFWVHAPTYRCKHTLRYPGGQVRLVLDSTPHSWPA